MRWQLATDWAVGPLGPIPATTVLTGVGDGHGGLAAAPIWRNQPVPVDSNRPMPLEAISLDQEAANLMRSWYQNYDGGFDLRYRLLFGPGVT
jgi:hypothetical protein